MKTLSESSLQTPRKLQEATVLLLTTTTHCCATRYLSQNSEQCRQSENGIRESALVGLYHMWIVHQETLTKSEVIYFFFYIFTWKLNICIDLAIVVGVFLLIIKWWTLSACWNITWSSKSGDYSYSNPIKNNHMHCSSPVDMVQFSCCQPQQIREQICICAW